MTPYMKVVGTLRYEDGTRGFKCGVSELHRKVMGLFRDPPARVAKT